MLILAPVEHELMAAEVKTTDNNSKTDFFMTSPWEKIVK